MRASPRPRLRANTKAEHRPRVGRRKRVRALHAEGVKVAEIVRQVGISRASVYRCLNSAAHVGRVLTASFATPSARKSQTISIGPRLSRKRPFVRESAIFVCNPKPLSAGQVQARQEASTRMGFDLAKADVRG